MDTFHWGWLNKTNEWSKMWKGVYPNVPEKLRNQPKLPCATRQRWHLTGWPWRQIVPTDVQQFRSSQPIGAHRRGTKPWLLEGIEDQCFRKHPESSLLGTGTFCLEQLREPAKSCCDASPAHFQSEARRWNQGQVI